MKFGTIAEMSSASKNPNIIDIDIFLERYKTEFCRAKLARLTTYTFYYRGREIGILDYPLPILNSTFLTKEGTRTYFSLFKENLNPLITHHLFFDSEGGIRIFNYYTIGKHGFFDISESKRQKNLLHSDEISICFEEISRHLKEKK